MKMCEETEELMRRYIEAAEKEDWTVEVEDESEDYVIYNFQKYSPAGYDFNFSAEMENDDPDTLLHNIYLYYMAFDPSYEAYLWLDNTGHGRNGAPYEMGDVYEDMVACEDMIKELYDVLSRIYL